LGSILGDSSSVVIMPALRMAKLFPKLANVVNLESALTDVLCVVVTLACVRVGLSGYSDPGDVALTLGKAFGIGLGIGVSAGLLAFLALKVLKRSSHAYPIILGSLIVLYVVIDYLEGSAALGILAFAVLVGNAPALAGVVGLSKRARLSQGVESTHDQITFIVKSFFFTFIGIMLPPPDSRRPWRRSRYGPSRSADTHRRGRYGRFQPALAGARSRDGVNAPRDGRWRPGHVPSAGWYQGNP
jgi:cell volume regulation protein A